MIYVFVPYKFVTDFRADIEKHGGELEVETPFVRPNIGSVIGVLSPLNCILAIGRVIKFVKSGVVCQIEKYYD
jgi:hypothetical protein